MSQPPANNRPLIQLTGYRANFDRGASALVEAAWVLCKFCFFFPRLPFPSAWRVWLLRRFGAAIGRGVVIRAAVNVTHPWRLAIGDHVWIGEEVWIHNLAPVTIGSNVCLSQRAFLCAASHDFRRESFDLVLKPIVVESHAWVAAGSLVLPGVTVGEGALVCGGSVVCQDVPPRASVRGNPAE
ncbi:putative acetyltransferase [Posidoniimonas polymericola]|uniref:Putative acetyltransferase n=1 Tax=Posidoniimonas polymericola TaxID=2528002 RepID=A0A5C5YTV5_9BACT|nr:WcaF family extracellular polysaccharide biosynthesis acetyltransferase [Posidoniimonas polymericola]TWT78415.1 putative acetyltransferase [Posidoniimonas polymericola]